MANRQITWISAFGFIILMVAAVAWAIPVPDTGQTKCYDVAGTVITCPSPGQPLYGQDANNQPINPMSYTKLDDSGNALPDSATNWVMVRDNVTGLIWEMKTHMDGVTNYNDPHDADNIYTWYDSNPATNGGDAGTPGDGTNTESFIKALNDANYGGYSDWRLPTVQELAYIVNYSIPEDGPAINTGYFPNTAASWYRPSTTFAGSTSYAWLVDFSDGYVGFNHKYNSGYVRAVRDGQSELLGNSVIGSFDTLDSGLIDDAAAVNSYTDNGDGTITDTSTSLMWQQAVSSNGMTWEEALAYCEGLNLGGYTDWRLPTIKELRSLVDYSRYNPAIDTTYFPYTAASWYWSSTTVASSTNDAWSVWLHHGNDHPNYRSNKYFDYYVRAVRGGQPGSFGYLVISPVSRAVAKEAGTTTFSVSNTGTGTMLWAAEVASGGGWLAITSGASGSNAGTITCSFTANTSTSVRIVTIRVTATGATGSPVEVTVIQAPTPTPERIPVYRFFNNNAGGHFYTIDEAEKNTVIQNYNWFRYEGIGFYAFQTQQPGTSPVYRFFNNNAGGHFYTIDEAEKNTVIQSYNWFRYEGIGFYAFPTKQPGTLPVYRFFNTIAGGHFFTMYETEKDTVIQNYPQFRFEGIGFYAYPSQ